MSRLAAHVAAIPIGVIVAVFFQGSLLLALSWVRSGDSDYMFAAGVFWVIAIPLAGILQVLLAAILHTSADPTVPRRPRGIPLVQRTSLAARRFAVVFGVSWTAVIALATRNRDLVDFCVAGVAGTALAYGVLTTVSRRK